MWSRASFRLLVLAGLGGGCSGADGSAHGSGASIAVRTFFEAAEGNDCAKLATVLVAAADAKAVDKKQCDAVFADFNDRQVRLVALGEPKRDGRTPSAWMIMADVEFNGGPHKWLMRAEFHDGSWKVRF